MTLPSATTWPRRLAPQRAASLPLLLLFFFTGLLQAAEDPDPTVKIREQLRAVTLQLRSAQTDSANAQAAAAAADQKSKDLAAKIADLEKNNATLIKQAATDKAAAAASIATLEAKTAARDTTLADYQQALVKWKAGYEKAAAVANDKEDQRAKLAAEAILLKRTVADCERKNLSLFTTAGEILDRYRDYSLGKAITAREPFIGTTRVKLENQVQGYQDRILDQRIAAPGGPPSLVP